MTTNMQKIAAGRTRLDLWLIPVVLALGFLAGLIEAGRSPDPRMAAQGAIFAACMLVTGLWYLWTYAGVTPFLVSDLVRTVILVAFPSISLFLVRWLY